VFKEKKRDSDGNVLEVTHKLTDEIFGPYFGWQRKKKQSSHSLITFISLGNHD
jgi:hypothetical protein